MPAINTKLLKVKRLFANEKRPFVSFSRCKALLQHASLSKPRGAQVKAYLLYYRLKAPFLGFEKSLSRKASHAALSHPPMRFCGDCDNPRCFVFRVDRHYSPRDWLMSPTLLKITVWVVAQIYLAFVWPVLCLLGHDSLDFSVPDSTDKDDNGQISKQGAQCVKSVTFKEFLRC